METIFLNPANVEGYFEPVELWVHYINQDKADVVIGLFYSAEDLTAAYADAKETYRYELENNIIELIEEEEEEEEDDDGHSGYNLATVFFIKKFLKYIYLKNYSIDLIN